MKWIERDLRDTATGECPTHIHSTSNADVSADASNEHWYIMTSIRIDPQLYDHLRTTRYYMLRYHQTRMQNAARCFGWHEAEKTLQGDEGSQNLVNALDTFVARSSDKEVMLTSTSYKLQVVVDRTGLFHVSASEVPKISIANLYPKSLSALDSSPGATAWRVFVSPVSTTPSMFTKHKTTHRGKYDEVRKYIPAWAVDARDPGNKGTMPEILLVNTQGEIMEGSITTPYFFRNGRWITPPAASGGNIGTTRRWALESGLCVEEVVNMRDVETGESVWLSNGARGWALGTVTER